MTTHLADPECAWTLSVAYRMPMMNIQDDKPIPPVITEALRPQLSAKMKAGTDTANMRIAETPDARKEAVPLERPACSNRVGAY